MRIRWHILLGVVCWPAVQLTAAEAGRVDFARDVQPIFQRSCLKCHGAEKQKGGLRFDGREGALGVGDSGKKTIVSGKAAESELLRRVRTLDVDERMPPKGEALSADEIRIIEQWINEGADWPAAKSSSGGRLEMVVTAEDRRHWSYRPLRGASPPMVKDGKWGRTNIDRFILAKLEERGIAANPPADRRMLIRRVYFDMIGLPPTPEEVEAFIADGSADAYEKLVDRLLSSAHYGERWGRHWLDVARYADSDGYESDADRPSAYHYRDFVIRALNDDLSYQAFVRWQLAGDEYEPDDPRALAATGFLTAAPNQPLSVPMEEEKLRLRFAELDDMAATTGLAFLGLTVGCARCHDHKFDAIPTRDYYRIQCAFMTTERDEVLLASREEARRFREAESKWNKELKSAEKRLNDWLGERKKAHSETVRHAKIDTLSISSEEKKLLKEQGDSEAGKKLAKKFEKQLQATDEDYRRIFNEEHRGKWDALKKEVDGAKGAQPKKPPVALAIVDRKAEPEATWLLDRGNFNSKKEPVQLGFLTVLTNGRRPEEYWSAARADSPSKTSTGQRRALAEWMTDVEHGAGALLARVMVNRVWQNHFGEGLVRTSSDFGVRGEMPSHPELLEFLAHEFVAGGWKLKGLHRSILLSAVYRQAGMFDEKRAEVDPENRLLWRRRPLRLESEILRDAVLAVSGTLNAKQFGPAFKPPIPAEAMLARNTKSPYPTDARDTPETRRRTVYMFHKRVVQHPLMQAFDGPDAQTSCGRRSSTTVAPQALALLNDTFMRDRARDFAKRLLAKKAENTDALVNHGFTLALSRGPSDEERLASVEFVERQIKGRTDRDKAAKSEDVRVEAVADFCQALFGLNEFIYVD